MSFEEKLKGNTLRNFERIPLGFAVCPAMLLLRVAFSTLLSPGRTISWDHFPQGADLSNNRARAHCSIVSAHVCLPQNRAHCSARNPLPVSVSTGDAPAKSSNLAHRVLPCRAAFINGVKPRLFFGSIIKLRHLVISMLTTSERPAWAAKCSGVLPSLSGLFTSMPGSWRNSSKKFVRFVEQMYELTATAQLNWTASTGHPIDAITDKNPVSASASVATHVGCCCSSSSSSGGTSDGRSGVDNSQQLTLVVARPHPHGLDPATAANHGRHHQDQNQISQG